MIKGAAIKKLTCSEFGNNTIYVQLAADAPVLRGFGCFTYGVLPAIERRHGAEYARSKLSAVQEVAAETDDTSSLAFSLWPLASDPPSASLLK
jgi:hypothetical protein